MKLKRGTSQDTINKRESTTRGGGSHEGSKDRKYV